MNVTRGRELDCAPLQTVDGSSQVSSITQDTKMPEWNPIDSAPKDGTWINARGWDFGLEGSRRHYAIARFDNNKWIEADGNQLRYLTDWQKLSHGPFIIDHWL